MDEAGNHHSQQTNTGTENQMPHVLMYKWKLNDEQIEKNNTHGSIEERRVGGGRVS